MRKKVYFSSSIICADILNMTEEIEFLERNNFDYIHYDVMDATICGDYSFGAYLINKLVKSTTIKSDFHIMAFNWQDILSKLYVKPGDILSIHSEYCINPLKQLRETKDKYPDLKICLLINPATGLEEVEYLLYYMDMIGLMSVNPGEIGKKFIGTTHEKLVKLVNILNSKHLNMDICVDGNINENTIGELVRLGANYFVLGSTGLYKGDKQKQFDLLKELCKG